MTYSFTRNGCECGYERYKWSHFGRCQSAQASLAIDELGRLFAWGRNYNWQTGLGDDAADDEYSEIEFAIQVGSMRNWLKAGGGEKSSMALNAFGELWGCGDTNANSAPFGLPAGSGVGGSDEYYLWTQCNSDYFWIDFAHDYYCTIALSEARDLYFFGEDIDGDAGQGNWLGSTYQTPTIISAISDVMIIDAEYGPKAAVTADNKVYVWGYFWGHWQFYYNIPTEITGLPGSAVIVDMSASPYGIAVVLSDGSIWMAGEGELYGDAMVTGDSNTFQQVSALSARNITKVKMGGLGGLVATVLDDEGNIWGTEASGDSYWAGTSTSATPTTDWDLYGSEFEGENNWIDMCPNTHQQVYQAIDAAGYLWTWGWQGWGTHLAVGAKAYTSRPGNLTDIVLTRTLAGLAAEAYELDGDRVYLNNLPSGDSPYIGGT